MVTGNCDMSSFVNLPAVEVYNPSDNVARVQFTNYTEPIDLTHVNKVQMEIYSGFLIDTINTPLYIQKADQIEHRGVVDIYLGRIPQLSQKVYNIEMKLFDFSVPLGKFFGFLRANVHKL